MAKMYDGQKYAEHYRGVEQDFSELKQAMNEYTTALSDVGLGDLATKYRKYMLQASGSIGRFMFSEVQRAMEILDQHMGEDLNTVQKTARSEDNAAVTSAEQRVSFAVSAILEGIQDSRDVARDEAKDE